MSNFLPIPTKRADPLPNLPSQLLSYITTHFRDTHPEAFRKDVDALVQLRKEFVEPKSDAHPAIVQGLLRYHAQLAFLATKFPSNVAVQFSYHLPFPAPFSLAPDATVSLPSLTFERAAVLYNIAALYGTMAAQERRAEAEGIKRALGFLSSAAGVLDHLVKVVLPQLLTDLSSSTAAGYDMTESFLTAMRDFMLAEAQECYWQQAVLQGTYKNGVIAKLSMKVSEYYKSALTAANGTNTPSAGFFPANWIAHITIKQHHFEAAAQYRLSKEDLEKARYGDEIARLRVAEGLAKKGLDSRKGVADSVVSDLKELQSAVKEALDRAVRDNDLVYVSPIPPASQLSQIVGAGMVKLATPKEVVEPVAWLMGGGAGMPALFSGLVPYGVHLALSIYDDRKDTAVRELDGKREELDGLAASTLQSLNLPGSIQALERPVGLPPSLLKKAEEVESAGGVDKIHSLLDQVQRLSRQNGQLLSEAMDILDEEATENENLLAREPHLAQSRQPSHVANQHLIATAGQYDSTIKQASSSDGTVRAKWDEWSHLIDILAGGEDTMSDHIPSTSSPTSLPASVRPLRASLEDLDDRIALRAKLVLQEASRLAHGGSGDVKPEWFEDIFGKGMEKYERVQRDMGDEAQRQEALLERIRTQNEAFLAERKDDPRIKERERSLQEMDMAYWKWREIIDNAEEGIKFHNSFADMLMGFKSACLQFLNSRRTDVGQITAGLQHASISSPPPQEGWHSPPPSGPSQAAYRASSPAPSFPSAPISAPISAPPAPGPAHRPVPTAAPTSSFTLAHPNSSQWQTPDSFLPPPPPPPIPVPSGAGPAGGFAKEDHEEFCGSGESGTDRRFGEKPVYFRREEAGWRRCLDRAGGAC
ncbi:pH-response regulator protein palA/rim20 [Saitozyma podzolica]|uniref:pH-response regulator protein palA/rim20 n=1 Tax=Saitozyma podzolica TaxID=1890683 RepID=A0A427Y3N7_9TREE|nr:pH-response regulator protein palA/rim20 [Saitozyma podzolica]